jgi:ketosteroid isomerase-like protein
MFEEEKAVVQRWVNLLAGKKDEVWDGFDKVLDPDMTWTVPGTTCVSGTHRGLKAIDEDFFGRCWTTGDGRGSGVQGLDDSFGLKMEVQNLVALEDGRVLVTCTSDARGHNGVPYNNNYCWIITVRDGRIVKLDEWCDTVMFETAMFDKVLVPAENLPEGARSK